MGGRWALHSNGNMVIIDTGCGEDTLFSNILLSLRWEDYKPAAIGLDISKQRISLASKRDKESAWIVGDISNLPARDSSVDVLLNTLTPANYQEFNRVLKDDGLLIKTVPNKGYLKELRQAVSKSGYSNPATIKHLQMNVNTVREIRIHEKISLEKIFGCLAVPI